MTPEQKQMFEAMARLEATGGMPPGYELVEGEWIGWKYKGEEGASQQQSPDAPMARGSAWHRFWTKQVGHVPPGYALVEDNTAGDRHAWVKADDAIRSWPKASVEEARAEAWADFKATLIGAERPKSQEAGGDPRAIMARFQQYAFQLVTVEVQLDQLDQQRQALIRAMKGCIEQFNESMAGQVADVMTKQTRGPGGQG
jgi:hypothetical protein